MFDGVREPGVSPLRQSLAHCSGFYLWLCSKGRLKRIEVKSEDYDDKDLSHLWTGIHDHKRQSKILLRGMSNRGDQKDQTRLG